MDHPTEAEYTAAMERHGSDAWTEQDARVQRAWLAYRTAEGQPADVAPAALPQADEKPKGR